LSWQYLYSDILLESFIVRRDDSSLNALVEKLLEKAYKLGIDGLQLGLRRIFAFMKFTTPMQSKRWSESEGSDIEGHILEID
jgi:hypothetical protein